MEAVFKSEKLITKAENEANEEDMHYTALPSARVHIKNEAAGRIHSIVTKDAQKVTRIRTKSPRMRAVSPKMHIETKPQYQIQQEKQHLESDMVHLVVNTHNKLDVHTNSVQQQPSTPKSPKSPITPKSLSTPKSPITPKSPGTPKSPTTPKSPKVPPRTKSKPAIPKEVVEEVMPVEYTEQVESGNPDFTFDDESKKAGKNVENDHGKLDVSVRYILA